uniref:Uncharacterized protein n=1 Tax=Lactuca sativa TaxID=4236 RepID=A0A9R1UUZ7_LACSA|nr:hypothetical protein LSAT_V11C800420120 [Lactuca sativa]
MILDYKFVIFSFVFIDLQSPKVEISKLKVFEVHEHDHPLRLVDLQLEYPHYEEKEEDDDDDRVKKEGFSQVICSRYSQIHHVISHFANFMLSSPQAQNINIMKCVAIIMDVIFPIDVNCVVEVGKNIIHHFCHPHLLICDIPKPILCDFSAGKRQ